MPFNNTNLFLSLAMLQNTGVERDKMFAASVSAALMPGILGLAIPLIVARNAAGTSTDAGAGTASDGPTKTVVPDVQGMDSATAIKAIQDAGLNPVVTHVFFKEKLNSHTAPAKDKVASQDPKPSAEWVDVGSDVRLDVSLGTEPLDASDEAAIDQDILAIDRDLQQRVTIMGEKVDQILTRVGDSGKPVSAGNSSQ